MTIIYVPFDVEVFWQVLILGSIFAGLGLLFDIARQYQGTNARRSP